MSWESRSETELRNQKTKYMSYNQHGNVAIKTNSGSILEEFSKLKYLGVHGCIVHGGMLNSRRKE